MQPFEVPPDEGAIDGPAAVHRPTKLLCQFPVIFPGSHTVLISMPHKFCSRMQAAGSKLTLIAKPRPRPTAVRRELGGPEGNTGACCSADLSAFRHHRKDKANFPKGNIVGLWFFPLFLLLFFSTGVKQKHEFSIRQVVLGSYRKMLRRFNLPVCFVFCFVLFFSSLPPSELSAFSLQAIEGDLGYRNLVSSH